MNSKDNNKSKTTTTNTLTTIATVTGTTVTTYRNQTMESDQDALLASSQETITSATGGTSHSTPVATAENIVGTNQSTPNLHTEPCTSKAAQSSNQSTLAAKGENRKKRKKSLNQVRKSRYQRAIYVLGEIAKDQAAGTSIDEEETKRLHQIVKEYESFLKRKQSEPPVEIEKQNKSQKRNRSQNDQLETLSKKSKQGTERSSTTARHFCDVARDSLQVAVIDDNSSTPTTFQEKWVEIDIQGDQVRLSLDFLTGSIGKISDAFVGIKLKLIPAKDIPRRPRARIWLPPLEEPGEKLLRCIKLENKSIPGIDEWQLIKDENPNKSSRPILVATSEESIEALSKAENKISFGISRARLKVFQGDKVADEDDTEEVQPVAKG
ncbi:uncharacterized protein LOC105218338 [Zeugodacus cucurbitae]|uniref:uncharacterized protein LOC105218338 n=1 Tax=Zeugodacus cucurbitae TaxID=28588 RepID=UPI0023D90605|nr:uncharacterized protein LOC105218338 [Zeugodacus cucurbitae]